MDESPTTNNMVIPAVNKPPMFDGALPAIELVRLGLF